MASAVRTLKVAVTLFLQAALNHIKQGMADIVLVRTLHRGSDPTWTIVSQDYDLVSGLFPDAVLDNKIWGIQTWTHPNRPLSGMAQILGVEETEVQRLETIPFWVALN